MTLRPPMILIGIPILIYKKWKLFIGAICGLLFGITSPLILTDISIWKKYFSAILSHTEIPIAFEKISLGTYNSIYPGKIIEGMANLGSGARIETTDSSIQAIFIRFLGISLSTNILLISLVSILLIISILLLKFRIKNISTNMVFLIGIVIVFISEFFIPAARYTYYNIIWLIPLSLVVINSELVSSWLNPLIIFLFIGLFFSISIPFAPGGLLISDLAIVCYAVFSTIFLIRVNWQNENRKFIEGNPKKNIL